MAHLEHIVEHVLSAHAAGQAPAAIILLGDIDAPRPLHIELEKIRELTEIFWIPGNHDGDDNSAWNNLVASELSDANLHCRVAQVGSWRVAGLGGIFRKKIWSPPEEPRFASYEAWRAELIARRPPQALGHQLKQLTSAATRPRFSPRVLPRLKSFVPTSWSRMKRRNVVTTAVAGRPSVTSLVALVSASHSMATTMTAGLLGPLHRPGIPSICGRVPWHHRT